MSDISLDDELRCKARRNTYKKPSGFFNFFRTYRVRHQGTSELKIAVSAARKWQEMAARQKKKYATITPYKEEKKIPSPTVSKPKVVNNTSKIAIEPIKSKDEFDNGCNFLKKKKKKDGSRKKRKSKSKESRGSKGCNIKTCDGDNKPQRHKSKSHSRSRSHSKSKLKKHKSRSHSKPGEHKKSRSHSKSKKHKKGPSVPSYCHKLGKKSHSKHRSKSSKTSGGRSCECPTKRGASAATGDRKRHRSKSILRQPGSKRRRTHSKSVSFASTKGSKRSKHSRRKGNKSQGRKCPPGYGTSGGGGGKKRVGKKGASSAALNRGAVPSMRALFNKPSKSDTVNSRNSRSSMISAKSIRLLKRLRDRCKTPQRKARISEMLNNIIRKR